MDKCSTLLYLNDSLSYPNEKLIEIGKLLDEIDLTLDTFFTGKEIEASQQLVSKTMDRVNKLV